MAKLLVISPHADDAEISCGGYMAKTVAEGGDVMVALMTVAEVKFRHAGTVSEETRLNEFRKSLKFLGVQRVVILSNGLDGRMYTAPQSDFVTLLDDIIDDYKPDTVLIPLPSSHQDHRYAWEVGIAATRPNSAKHQPQLIAAYEYPLSGWGPGGDFNSGQGGMYVDVAKYWDDKIAALNAYETQMREKQNLISLNSVSALASLRGLEAGYEKAELFHILRMRC